MILFIGTDIYSAFQDKISGGAEKQQMLLIKGFAQRGMSVCVIDSSLCEEKRIDEISFIPSWELGKGLPGLRFFTYRIPHLISLIAKIHPDIIYVRGCSLYGGSIFLLLNLFITKHIRLIWGLASDRDITCDFSDVTNKSMSVYSCINREIINRLSSKALLRYSSKIICQTSEHIDMCKQRGRTRDTIELGNVFKPLRVTGYSSLKDIDCLWVGKLSGIKGEEILLEIVRRLPYYKFVIIGDIKDNFKDSSVSHLLSRCDNLSITGRLSQEEIYEKMQRTKVLINTSPVEGFSNVFLEAWWNKLVVASYLVNPCHYLSNEIGGLCADADIDLFLSQISHLIAQPARRERLAERGYNLIIEKYHFNVLIDNYIKHCYEGITNNI